MIDPDALNVWNEQRLVGYLWRNPIGYIGFRYDRVWNKQGEVQRLHQEDFCQALGTGTPRIYPCYIDPTERLAWPLFMIWSVHAQLNVLTTISPLMSEMNGTPAQSHNPLG